MRVSFKTVGCRLNQAETARMAADFRAMGAERVPFESPADVCVIHTCAITGTAERTCVRTARAVKRRSPDTLVILAGCAAELDAETLLKRAGADLAVGQQDKFNLPSILRQRFGKPFLPVDSRGATGTACAAAPDFETTRALLKVQDGCDFRCSYCVVPDARGRPRSRPLREIVAEARAMRDAGYREISVTGANLGCYRDGAVGLVAVLRAIEALDGIERIRISSIESTTVERAVIDFMADSAKLCRYLHFPLQSGDDGILRAMRRRYRVADFCNTVAYADARIPHLGLGTDVMVGFPGEDERAFRNTHALLADLPFNNLHVFPYSPRPHTPAAELPGQVDGQVKKARAAELIALGETKRTAFARGLIGLPVSVLVERVDRSGAGHGWTGEYLPARLTRDGLSVNTIVRFTPTRFEDGALVGRPLSR